MNFCANNGIHAVQLPEAAQHTPAPGLSAILTPLRELIAARLLRTILAPIILPLWNYLKRVECRFARLAILHAAGKLPTPRPGAGRARSAQRSPRLPFPAAKAWLLKALKHEAAYVRLRLEAFLAQPDTAAFLAACPRAAGTLRTLFHMLGLQGMPCTRDPRPPGPLAIRRKTSRARPTAARPSTTTVLAAPCLPAPEPPPEPLRIDAIPLGSGLSPRLLREMCPRAAALWPFHPDTIRKKSAERRGGSLS